MPNLVAARQLLRALRTCARRTIDSPRGSHEAGELVVERALEHITACFRFCSTRYPASSEPRRRRHGLPRFGCCRTRFFRSPRRRRPGQAGFVGIRHGCTFSDGRP